VRRDRTLKEVINTHTQCTVLTWYQGMSLDSAPKYLEWCQRKKVFD